MKYWNKDKDVRQRCWTKVTLSNKTKIQQVVKNGWVQMQVDVAAPVSEIKRWCQLQGSTGKFYTYFGADSWWFENEQDATMFLLKWS